MASYGSKLTITIVLTGFATPVYAWEVSAFAGQETIFSSDVLPDAGATGWVGGGKLLWSPAKLPVSLGISGSFSQYQIDADDEIDSVTTSKSGAMYGWHCGPTFVVKAPWSTVTPFLSASFSIGEYDYDVDSRSSYSSGGSVLATDLNMGLDYSAQTLTGSVGFRVGGIWGVTFEYVETRHLFIVSSASATVANSIDGERQSSDGGEETISDLVGQLEGERFHHTARGVLLGISYRP